MKRNMLAELDRNAKAAAAAPPGSVIIGGAAPTTWGHSSVSTFGVRYTPPLPDLSPSQSIEALVEGSDMSMLREGTAFFARCLAALLTFSAGSPMTAEYAWAHREGRRTRYESNRVGGTIVVHFIKKNMWYLETALALLEGEEQSEAERYEAGRAKAVSATRFRRNSLIFMGGH